MARPQHCTTPFATATHTNHTPPRVPDLTTLTPCVASSHTCEWRRGGSRSERLSGKCVVGCGGGEPRGRRGRPHTAHRSSQRDSRTLAAWLAKPRARTMAWAAAIAWGLMWGCRLTAAAPPHQPPSPCHREPTVWRHDWQGVSPLHAIGTAHHWYQLSRQLRGGNGEKRRLAHIQAGGRPGRWPRATATSATALRSAAATAVR